MRRHANVVSVALALVALALILAACGGDDEKPTTGPAPRSGQAPSEKVTPPSAPGSLPPEFRKCMADRGFEMGSSADIHSAPPEALQACFGSLHRGGAAP